jgi:hypothetical protein
MEFLFGLVSFSCLGDSGPGLGLEKKKIERRKIEMPARSRRQQRWAFAVKGEKWARKHHFDKIQRKRKRKRKK